MKLEDFVKQTLIEITNGVRKATEKSAVPIAPSSIDGKKIPAAPQFVHFEVAVSAKKEGGAGVINVLPIELKGKLTSEHVNKISFQVPVYYELNWSNKRRDET
jgi:hypothetical protein